LSFLFSGNLKRSCQEDFEFKNYSFLKFWQFKKYRQKKISDVWQKVSGAPKFSGKKFLELPEKIKMPGRF
jgi:hypothetical protein